MDPEVIVRKAMTTARTEGCTVGQLSKVLHYSGTESIGDVFSMYAQYFKVFEEYCNNLDHARNRVDACKKLEVRLHARGRANTVTRAEGVARFAQVFKRAFKQCQEDPRSRGMDLHNWLQSTHHAPSTVPGAGSSAHAHHTLPWCLHQDRINI